VGQGESVLVRVPEARQRQPPCQGGGPAIRASTKAQRIDE
jgi:hypothetical protein